MFIEKLSEEEFNTLMALIAKYELSWSKTTLKTSDRNKKPRRTPISPHFPGRGLPFRLGSRPFIATEYLNGKNHRFHQSAEFDIFRNYSRRFGV